MNKFNKICEAFGVIETKKKIMYPRQIKLSEEFLEALKKEYYRQKLEEDSTDQLKDRPNKFSKALHFHIVELENNAAKELEAIRKQYTKPVEEKKNPSIRRNFLAKKITNALPKKDKTDAAVENRKKEIPRENI